MATVTDRIFVVVVDAADGVATENDGGSKACDSFHTIAQRGCSGFLAIPSTWMYLDAGIGFNALGHRAQPHGCGKHLEELLDVARNGGHAAFPYPTLPLTFLSSSSDSCALVRAAGVTQVHEIDAKNEAAAADLFEQQLSDPSNAKHLIMLHVNNVPQPGGWIDLLADRLLKAHSHQSFLFAVVQAAARPHQPVANAPHPLRPRQSVEKLYGKYLTEDPIMEPCPRLLYSFFQHDRTRQDEVQRFDERDIDDNGAYGTMHARVFMKEMAFRLGHAPKSDVCCKASLGETTLAPSFKGYLIIQRDPHHIIWNDGRVSYTSPRLRPSPDPIWVPADECGSSGQAKRCSDPAPKRSIDSTATASAHLIKTFAFAHGHEDDHEAMYHEVGEREPMLGGGPALHGGNVDKQPNGSVRSMRLETPAPKCNDMAFAIVFIVHVLVIAVFAFWKGVPTLAHQMNNPGSGTGPQPDTKAYNKIFGLSAGLMVIGLVLSGLWMKLLMAYAESMIRIALWLNAGMLLVFAVITFVANPIAACIFLLFAAINVCYIYAVQNRIGFASANLKTACAAVSQYSGVFVAALGLMVLQFVWLLFWAVSAIGVYQLFRESDPTCNMDNPNRPHQLCGGPGAGVAFFFMLISVYWGQQVIQNVLTCTTAGVVASWWYHPSPQSVTLGSLRRSFTTSFGSICFGSLLVAILNALSTIAHILREKAREDDNAVLACVACLAECIINCLRDMLEYINQWAYVYVGIYGYDFKTSGKAVMGLFTNRGWTAVINDDLTSSALGFGALGVGCVTACIGLLIAKFAPKAWFVVLGSQNGAFLVMGIFGFIAGVSMALVLSSVIVTSLHTVFVCFAEDPIAFSRNHPVEYESLVGGWRQFHNDALISAYGTAV
ncbi:TPA: hypothetical protein N0F65_012848 [Lagenidium giganteum]|uniref:DUF580-domain-containing protein n=1 Tax=Lagenidium giganteum TaxID=4803 RepID=A0AAV2YMX7_9STRA|nr:TPA: hypothetical protein N0F65_012848 [Lagenidium giganteum]